MDPSWAETCNDLLAQESWRTECQAAIAMVSDDSELASSDSERANPEAAPDALALPPRQAPLLQEPSLTLVPSAFLRCPFQATLEAVFAGEPEPQPSSQLGLESAVSSVTDLYYKKPTTLHASKTALAKIADIGAEKLEPCLTLDELALAPAQAGTVPVGREPRQLLC